jgi:hypothetical protein
MHASGNIFESILNTSSFDMIYVFIREVLGFLGSRGFAWVSFFLGLVWLFSCRVSSIYD